MTAPPRVRVLAGDAPVRAVWRSEAGGITFAVGEPIRWFVKWSPRATGIDLLREADRLRWRAGRVTVPALVDAGGDGDATWLVTEPLRGTAATDPRWRQRPDVAVTAIGAGLRRLHDTLAVADCPFTWRAADRLRSARDRRHLLDPARWHAEHRHLTVAEALERVRDLPEDDPVVCHGDACSPNTILGDDGAFVGHVDPWGTSAWPTGGPTWRWPPGAWAGTSGSAGAG